MKIKLLLTTLILVASQSALSSSPGLPTCPEIPHELSVTIGTICKGKSADDTHKPKYIGYILQGINRKTGENCFDVKHEDDTMCRRVCARKM